MNRIFIAIALGAAVALGACSNSTAQAETPATAQAPQSRNDSFGPERTGTVITLANDNTMRPGKKVRRLTVLDFNATWCGPCRQLSPVFKAAAAKYKNVDFISIDVDQRPETASAFRVQAVPTVVIMRPDGTSKTFVGTDGLLPQATFDALIESYLK